MAEVKFKVGDKCIITGNLMPHRFQIGDEVEIFRGITSLIWDVCNKKTGDCDWVSAIDLQLQLQNKHKNKKAMKAMKDAVLATAKSLAKANNTVTTLEIKNELRRDYPYYFWTQDIVSNFMDQLAGDGLFNYTDNGTYRTYSLIGAPKVNAKAKTVATKTVVSKKVLPKSKTISQGAAIAYASNPAFQDVTLKRKSGLVAYSVSIIRNQKKSPQSFVKNNVGNVTAITVANKTYKVK